MSGTTAPNTGSADAQAGYPHQANTAMTTDGFKTTGAQDDTTQNQGDATVPATTAEEGLETVEGQEGGDAAALDPKQQQQGGKLSGMLGRLTKGSDKAAEGQEGSAKK